MEINNNITVDNDVLVEFYESLDKLYKITTEYRNAFRAGNQIGINTTTQNLISAIQNLYYFYEKNIASNKYLADKANTLVEQYNKYGSYYNEFANSPDMMSETAQGYAKYAEIAFSSLVEMLLSYSVEIKPYVENVKNPPLNTPINFVGNTIVGSNNQIFIGEIHIDNSIKINQAIQQTENSGLGEETKREVLQKLEEIKQLTEEKAHKKNNWEKVKNILKWVAERSLDVAAIVVPVLCGLA